MNDMIAKFVSFCLDSKLVIFLIVIAFIFGAIFTPPDVISQILLAFPMIFLFELGVLFAKKITID